MGGGRWTSYLLAGVFAAGCGSSSSGGAPGSGGTGATGAAATSAAAARPAAAARQARWVVSSRNRSPGRRTFPASRKTRARTPSSPRSTRRADGAAAGCRSIFRSRSSSPMPRRHGRRSRGPCRADIRIATAGRTATRSRSRCRSRRTATPRGAPTTPATPRATPTGRATVTSWSSRPASKSSTSSTTPPRTATPSTRSSRSAGISTKSLPRQRARRSVHLGGRRRISHRRAAPDGRRGGRRRGQPRDPLHSPQPVHAEEDVRSPGLARRQPRAAPTPNAPPYGVRFRLKAAFDDSGYNASEKVIIAAMKKFGMLLSDGGTIPLTFADDRTSTAKWSDSRRHRPVVLDDHRRRFRGRRLQRADRPDRRLRPQSLEGPVRGLAFSACGFFVPSELCGTMAG